MTLFIYQYLGQKCHFQAKITGSVWATAMEFPSNSDQNGEQFGWIQKQNQNLFCSN